MNKSDYIEIRNELCSQLELMYQQAILGGNADIAEDCLYKLMSYHAIERGDSRIKKPKVNEQYAIYDYRRTDMIGMLPKCVFYDVAATGFNIGTIEHWGKRVEGNYSGDIRIEKNSVHIRVSPAQFKGEAEKDIAELNKILQHSGIKPIDAKRIIEEIELGMTKVFHAEISGHAISKYKTLAIGLCKLDNSGNPIMALAVKYEAVYNSWIDVAEFNAAVSEAMAKCLSCNVEVKLGNAPDKAIETQKNMMSVTKVMDDKRARLVAEEAQRAAAEAETKKNKKKATKKAG